MRQRMYQIWFSTGRGLQAGPRFRVLRDAVRHAEQHRCEASFAIRTPLGDWYQWPSIDCSILPRRAVISSRAVGGELVA